MNALQSACFDGDPKDNFRSSGMTPEACAANPVACAQGAMNSAASKASGLSCMGGGCFPTPINFTFLAPPTPMPVLAFPATLVIPTPVGPIPIPFPSFFNFPPTGSTVIPGLPYNSLIRLYAMPTLTGGLGTAVCLGPYTGSFPVPPPLFPIPYPPPLGNCITIALPVSQMPQCKVVESAVSKAMEFANKTITDVNSGISSINSGGLPAGIPQGAGSSGGSGLEVSLSAELADQQTFNVPAKNFSNTHIGSFDSIGGVIASWWDRQQIEITNKLLSFPTIQVIFPDLKNLFVAELNETIGLMENFNRATEVQVPSQGDWSSFRNGAKWAENVYNTSALTKLWAVGESLPFVNLNAHPITVKFPYASYEQLKDEIRYYQELLTYYQLQLD
jgi:hypothetical protein